MALSAASNSPTPTAREQQRKWLPWLGAPVAVVTAILAAEQFVSLFNWILLVAVLLVVAAAVIVIALLPHLPRYRALAVGSVLTLLLGGIAAGSYGAWDRYRGPHLTKPTSLALCMADN